MAALHYCKNMGQQTWKFLKETTCHDPYNLCQNNSSYQTDFVLKYFCCDISTLSRHKGGKKNSHRSWYQMHSSYFITRGPHQTKSSPKVNTQTLMITVIKHQRNDLSLENLFSLLSVQIFLQWEVNRSIKHCNSEAVNSFLAGWAMPEIDSSYQGVRLR